MSMEEWTNPIIPNQEIDLTLQDCLLPSDLGWLDQIQLSQVSPKSDMSSIAQPHGYTIAASDSRSTGDAPSISSTSGLLLESPKDLDAIGSDVAGSGSFISVSSKHTQQSQAETTNDSIESTYL